MLAWFYLLLGGEGGEGGEGGSLYCAEPDFSGIRKVALYLDG